MVYAAGNVQRPHLRHDARGGGQKPEHGSETVWHLRAKRLLRDWAWAAGWSADEEVIVRTGPAHRRADVLAELTGEIALEAQHSRLDVDQWAARHSDYCRAGVVDLWFYAPHNAPHLDTDPAVGERVFLLDLETEEVGVLVVDALAERPHEWWARGRDVDLIEYVDHRPRTGERWTSVIYVPLAECRLTDEGVELPEGLDHLGRVEDLEQEREKRRAERDADDERVRRGQQAAREAIGKRVQGAALRPAQKATARRKRCILCGFPLDPEVYANSDRHMPEVRCDRWC